MIDLPDPARRWDYENGFYLTCEPSRLAKMLAHYELFRQVAHLPGAVVECGVFKGASLCRFAIYRQLLGAPESRPIIGFDTFGAFPRTQFAPDVPVRDRFVASAGEQSISREQLTSILRGRGLDQNVQLVEGDICQTVPAYVQEHPELRIALLNLDTDIHEPAAVILRHLFPRLVSGGILMIDDYGVFPGETRAVDEYFAAAPCRIERLPFAATPCFIRKP